MIILTADEADKVRGLTVKYHALAPVPLNDGTFLLPMSVPDDPAHAAHADFLKSLQAREVELTEYLGYQAPPKKPWLRQSLPPEKDAILKANSFDGMLWPEGKTIKVLGTDITVVSKE